MTYLKAYVDGKLTFYNPPPGKFMYPAGAYLRLIGLVKAGLLNISAIRPSCFTLSELPQAMEAAAKASNLECVVVKPWRAEETVAPLLQSAPLAGTVDLVKALDGVMLSLRRPVSPGLHQRRHATPWRLD